MNGPWKNAADGGCSERSAQYIMRDTARKTRRCDSIEHLSINKLPVTRKSAITCPSAITKLQLMGNFRHHPSQQNTIRPRSGDSGRTQASKLCGEATSRNPLCTKSACVEANRLQQQPDPSASSDHNICDFQFQIHKFSSP